MWEVIDRPGYMGTSRDEIHAKWNDIYGKENWKIAWQWGKNIVERPEAILIYQRGYTEFLKSSPQLLEWLLDYEDVYDTAPTNIKAGYSYDIQETPSTHIHDVAIRRALELDLGLKFRKKNGLLHVRPDKEGAILGPQLIPFHLPNMIYRGKTKYKGKERDFYANPPWWITMGIKDSVEQFWQQNKILMRR